MVNIESEIKKLRVKVRDTVARVSKASARSVIGHSPDPTHPRTIKSMGSYIQSVRLSTNGVEDTSFTKIPDDHPDAQSRSKALGSIRKIKREQFAVGTDAIVSNNVPHADAVEYGTGWKKQREYAPMRLGYTEAVTIAMRECAKL